MIPGAKELDQMTNRAADEAKARLETLRHLGDADEHAGGLARAQVLAILGVVTAIEAMTFKLAELAGATAAVAARLEYPRSR